MDTKRCSKCKVTKPVDQFSKRRARKGGKGLQSWCKACQKERADNVFDKQAFDARVGCGTKTCTRCKQTLKLGRFHPNSYAKDGFQHYCIDCTRSYSKKVNERRRVDKEFREKDRAQARQRYKDKTPEEKQDAQWRWKLSSFGLTQDQYQQISDKQNGRCAICQQVASVRNGSAQKLCIDHCHVTGVVRGLLCFHCNAALGQFQENPDLLFRAYLYLRRSHVLLS